MEQEEIKKEISRLEYQLQDLTRRAAYGDREAAEQADLIDQRLDELWQQRDNSDLFSSIGEKVLKRHSML